MQMSSMTKLLLKNVLLQGFANRFWCTSVSQHPCLLCINLKRYAPVGIRNTMHQTNNGIEGEKKAFSSGVTTCKDLNPQQQCGTLNCALVFKLNPPWPPQLRKTLPSMPTAKLGIVSLASLSLKGKRAPAVHENSSTFVHLRAAKCFLSLVSNAPMLIAIL